MEPVPADEQPSSLPIPTDVCDALVRLGIVTQRQVLQARASVVAGQGPAEGLVELGFVNAAEVADTRSLLAELANAAELETYPIAAELLDTMPPTFAIRNQFLPLRRIGRRLAVAVAESPSPADPQRVHALDRLATMCGYPVVTWPVAAERVRRACHALYDPHSFRGALARAIERGVQDLPQAADGRAPVDAPVIDLVNDLIIRAADAGASDIHLDPLAGDTLIRYRVDGILGDALRIPTAIALAVVGRLKLMAELNIMERRHPQDGRFTLTHAGRAIDVRVAVAPTRYGELIVLRLLRQLTQPEGMGDLGMAPADLARFRQLVGSPNGILLVTGPTGSGKSTTLYATLSAIDRKRRHVVTIEDPIEYGIDRALQIQVNQGIGLTFAAALRSILRLDPNVILVGEIRDAETLEIAMHAAMTGHLVLSTLHANDVLTAFPRMIELGASARQITSCLLGVTAQRLLRQICAGCTEAYEPDEAERQALGLTPDEAVTLQRGAGCRDCGGTGYKGRRGVYEVLAMGDQLAQAVADSASSPTLRAIASESGMTTMWDDGKAKVLAGLTTTEELLRAVRRNT